MRRFTKGLLLGTMVGGVVGFMIEPYSSARVRRMRRKANKTIKNMGCVIEDFIARK